MDEDWLRCNESIYRELKEINEKVTHLRIEVAELKIKSGIWGMIGGVVSIAIMVAVEIFLKK